MRTAAIAYDGSRCRRFDTELSHTRSREGAAPCFRGRCHELRPAILDPCGVGHGRFGVCNGPGAAASRARGVYRFECIRQRHDFGVGFNEDFRATVVAVPIATSHKYLLRI